MNTSTTTDANGNPIVATWRGQVSLTSILDGSSNSLMFGEKHIRPNSLRGKNEDRSIFGGQNNSVRRMAGLAPNGDARPLRPALDQNGALACCRGLAAACTCGVIATEVAGRAEVDSTPDVAAARDLCRG